MWWVISLGCLPGLVCSQNSAEIQTMTDTLTKIPLGKILQRQEPFLNLFLVFGYTGRSFSCFLFWWGTILDLLHDSCLRQVVFLTLELASSRFLRTTCGFPSLGSVYSQLSRNITHFNSHQDQILNPKQWCPMTKSQSLWRQCSETDHSHQLLAPTFTHHMQAYTHIHIHTQNKQRHPSLLGVMIHVYKPST